jgi:hypothetical protein
MYAKATKNDICPAQLEKNVKGFVLAEEGELDHGMDTG